MTHNKSAPTTLISRKEAQRRGVKRYFTGVPCRMGHISERYVVAKLCLACLKWRADIRARRNKRKAEAAASSSGMPDRET
jgi:hypothetical protein